MNLAAVVIAAALLAVGGDSGRAQESGTAGARGSDTSPRLAVPFLPQGRLLCGGAAAAMVERFYGSRGVYAEDYADLVRPSEGGIRTTDLAHGLEARGYDVAVHEDDPLAAGRALEAGVPAVLLIRSGSDRFHYVVLVGWEAGAALVHDPLEGPSRRIEASRLARLHAAAGHWTMIARPASDGVGEGGQRSKAGGGTTPSPSSPTSRESASSRVPALDSGLVALRSGRPDDAELWARRLLAESGQEVLDPLAWQLLATARFRAGRRLEALDAWNRTGEPRVDLVVLHGAPDHRWTALAGRIPVRHGRLLRSRDLTLSTRRLESLPGIRDARLDYRPLGDGSVEVQAFLAERPRAPSAATALAEAARAVVESEARVEVGPLLAGAERWALSGRWLDADALARLAVTGPVAPLPGVAEVSLEWRRQRYRSADGEEISERRVRAGLEVVEWLTARARVGVRVGLERWPGEGRRASGGASLRRVVVSDRLGAELDVDGWAGSGEPYGRIRARLEGRLPRGERVWRLSTRGSWAPRHAPRFVWEGAGLGRVREPLLRGRRLVVDGAIADGLFGPKLIQGSLEHARLWSLGPARAGLALFLDAASAWGAGREDPEWGVSWGVQLEGEALKKRLEASLGTGSGAWIFSVRLTTPTPLF